MTTPEQAAEACKDAYFNAEDFMGFDVRFPDRCFLAGISYRDQNPSDAVKAKDAEILDLKCMLDGVEETAAKNEAYVAFELKQCQESVQGLVEALEKIADPRKRDHKEPDAYTSLGCVMHIADEALTKYREQASEDTK